MATIDHRPMFVKTVQMLKDQPCSVSMLYRANNADREYMGGLVKALHDGGLIYIYDWFNIGRSRRTYPFYAWRTETNQRDKAPPVPKTDWQKRKQARDNRASRMMDAMIRGGAA